MFVDSAATHTRQSGKTATLVGALLILMESGTFGKGSRLNRPGVVLSSRYPDSCQ